MVRLFFNFLRFLAPSPAPVKPEREIVRFHNLKCGAILRSKT